MHLSIRSKLVLLCIFPVLLFALLISGISILSLKHASEEQVRDAREMLIAVHKSALEHSVQAAQSVIAPIYAASERGDMTARDKAVSILKGMSYGVDGHYFGLNSESVRVFWADKNIKIGESFKSFQAPDGQFVFNELVRVARDGTHFLPYRFSAPNSDKLIAKIGYTVYLEKWDLVIGTAVSVDDIDVQVSRISEDLTDRSRTLIHLILGLSVAAFLMLAVVAGWLVKRLLAPLEHLRNKMDEIAPAKAIIAPLSVQNSGRA